MDKYSLSPGRKRKALGKFQTSLLVVFAAMALQACGGCGEISLGGDTLLDGYESSGPDQDSSQDGAVPQVTTWARTYGFQYNEKAFAVEQTSDGGYIVAGDTDASGDDAVEWWVIKLDREGNVQWQKLYGGRHDDVIASIIATTDGGYALSGYTRSYGSGEYDHLVLKLDASGDIAWQKAYGGEGVEANTLGTCQTPDNGYILAGLSGSFGDQYGMWVLKLDESGQVKWQKKYCHEYYHECIHQGGSLVITAGGDIVLTLEDPGNYPGRYVIARLDPAGSVLWSREYRPGMDHPNGPSAIQTAANGDLLFAGTWPWGGEISGCWVMRLDPDGRILWSRTYTRDGWDFYRAMAIGSTDSGGSIVAGVGLNGSGGDSFWLFELDGSGAVIWEKAYGAMLFDHHTHKARSVRQTSDRGFVVAGYTNTYGAGNMDFWVLKTDPEGTIHGDCPGIIGVHTEAVVTQDMPTVSEAPLTVLDTDCIVTDATIRPKDTEAISRFQCGG